MRHIRLLFLALLLFPMRSHAAYEIDYDTSLEAQFTMSHTGLGKLTPSEWYELLHHSYKNWVEYPKELLSTPSLTVRQRVFLSYLEYEAQHADSVREDLKRRAEAEAKTLTEMKFSGALGNPLFISGRDKFADALSDMEQMAGKLVIYGAPHSTYQEWKDYIDGQRGFVDVLLNKVSVPFADRLLQLKEMISDVQQKSRLLASSLQYYAVRHECGLSGSWSFSPDMRSHAVASMNTWVEAARSVTGSGVSSIWD